MQMILNFRKSRSIIIEPKKTCDICTDRTVSRVYLRYNLFLAKRFTFWLHMIFHGQKANMTHQKRKQQWRLKIVLQFVQNFCSF